MKFLFIHQNFPGQFLHLIRDLARSETHEIICISNPNENRIPGVRKLTYPKPKVDLGPVHPDAREFSLACLRGQAVAQLARTLRGLGFVPDVIIGHPGWGEMLHLADVFPAAPQIAYFEFFYQLAGADVGFDAEFPTPEEELASVRVKNAVNLLTLNNPCIGQTPTRWQHSTYPAWARPRIRIVPEGVNLDVCTPDASVRRQDCVLEGRRIGPEVKLVTYVARNIEPYRGCHVLIRALPALLRARPDVQVVMVGGHEASYGPAAPAGGWAVKYLREVAEAIDPARLHLPGKLPYADYIRLLQRSDAHVYLSFPFVASWSLREALACGCVIIGSDTAPVAEFISDGENGRLVPFGDAAVLAESILDVLERPKLARKLARGARRYAERNLAMATHLAAFHGLVGEAVG